MNANQIMVRLRFDGGSWPLPGDALWETDRAAIDGKTIPFLLQAGWRIVSVHATAAAGLGGNQPGARDAEQTAAFVLLEK